MAFSAAAPGAGPDRSDLVLPVRRDPTGRAGPTAAQTRGGRWRRTSHGFYVPASVPRTLGQRILEASVVLPEHGGVTGWAALRWAGGVWFDGLQRGGDQERPVCLVTSCDDIRSQPGIHVSAERLDPRDLTAVAGLRVTTMARAVCFEMRYAASVRDAVRVLDMAAYSDLVSIAEVAEFASRHSGWTGIPRCREAIGLAHENSWSPTEVDLRLIWVLDAELAPPRCNTPVFDRAGTHVGTPDLLDVEAGVVGEYDGRLHLAGGQRARDLRKEEAYRRHGLEYFTVVASDLGDRHLVVERIHAARRRARWEPEGTRSWTVEPPTWWTPTLTVDQRRALPPAVRARLLAHRTQIWGSP